jgi:hypothetical protein
MREYSKISPQFWIGNTGQLANSDPTSKSIARSRILKTCQSSSLRRGYELSKASTCTLNGFSTPCVLNDSSPCFGDVECTSS